MVIYRTIYGTILYDITCRTLRKFKSDTDQLYTAGDRVTHIETGTAQLAVLDRDEKCAFRVLVAVTSAGLSVTTIPNPFLSRTDPIAAGFLFFETDSYSSN